MVRRVTAENLIFANTADVVDVLHRLIARSRALVRHQRLLLEALEEVALWMPVPPAAPALNGPTMDSSIWSNVARQAAQGDGDGNASQSPLQHPVTALLLQPGLPPSMPEVERNLPSLSRGTLAGLRRRAWQEHVAQLLDQAGDVQPSSSSSDAVLFL